MKVVIFSGPSLPLDEARAILDAEYLPPIRQSGLLSALRTHKPDVVGIVDGMRLSTHPVWHKEILHAMESGVLVYGAGGVGAVRAADLEPFGMRGVGHVFRHYRDGIVIDEDEIVAATSPDGMTRCSEPMINIRATLEAATVAGVIDEAACRALVSAVKALFYPDRTYERVFEEADRCGLDAAIVSALRDFVAHHGMDLPRQDAFEMLRAIAALPADAVGPKRDIPPPMLGTLPVQYQRDRMVRRDGCDIALHEIADYAALHCGNYADLHFAALNRTIVQVFANQLGLEVTARQIDDEAERFRLRRELEEDGAFDAWLENNDLSRAEFRELMAELARCRCLHRWLMTTRRPLDRSTKFLLDEMRLAGCYGEWADRAAFQEDLLHAGGIGLPDLARESDGIANLVQDHLVATGRRPDTGFTDWAVDSGLTPPSLILALLKARAARRLLGTARGAAGAE